MAILIRNRDGEGFSGSRIDSFDPNNKMKLSGHEPKVGHCLLVGSITAGTFSARDWWMTTPITEIISESENEIRFNTKNSSYILKK